MNHSKKTLLIIAVLALITTSCRKGEDDPFLSFRSRKSRLTGEWVLKSGTVVKKSTSFEDVDTYNGSSVYSSTDTIPYTEVWKFNKDGSFEYKQSNTGNTVNNLWEGTWSFGNKDEAIDLKNKESVILRVTRVKYEGSLGLYDTYYSGTNCLVYSRIIKQLRNKTMTFEIDGSSTSSNPSISYTGTMTYEKL